MEYEKGKITVRQTMLLTLTTVCSPLVRIVPNFAAYNARQAAWVVPLIGCVLFMPIVYVFYSFAKQHGDKDFIEIMNQVCGKIISKVISFVFLIWIIFLSALYLRYYAERLLSTILPNVHILIFLISMGAVSWAVARKSAVTLARMNEVIIIAVVITLVACAVFAIPKINIDNLRPVSTLDIIPSLKGSLGIMGLWSYMPFLFMFLPIIKNRVDIKSSGVKAVIYLALFSLLAIVIAVGILGNLILTLPPVPFFLAIKQISVFGYIERLEAFVISLWLISDFVLLAVFMTLAGNITKGIFAFQESRPMTTAYIFIIFPLSFMISRNLFELQEFSRKFVVYGNLVLGAGVPIIIFIIGKIKNKVQSSISKKSTAL